MDFFNFYRDLQAELSNYPWLEMLVSLTLLILFAALANFIAKRIIVRGIRHLVTKIKSLNQSVFAQHSVIKRFANIVPAIVIMNGITTVPHLSEKAVALVQMGAQAFIFLTIALTISELLNIFNLRPGLFSIDLLNIYHSRFSAWRKTRRAASKLPTW